MPHNNVYKTMTHWIWIGVSLHFSLFGTLATYAETLRSAQSDPFGDVELLEDGWRKSAWLGYYNAAFSPWIYQREHGWMFLAEDTASSQDEGVWMWTLDFGWIWTNSANYPFLYRSVDQSWLFYYRDTASPRWFFNVNTVRGESPDPVRILALGDSYTIGESVAESGRWPVQFANLLRARGLTVEGPRIIARTGWTTTEMLQAVESADLTPPYELVTLLIGVNDQFRGLSLEGYRENFATALDRAIELAGGDRNRVIVLSIPDYAVTPFARAFGLTGIGPIIDAFNGANFSITEAAGVHYVNVTPISRKAATDPTLIAFDGLHPSASMYAEWSRLALLKTEAVFNLPEGTLQEPQ